MSSPPIAGPGREVVSAAEIPALPAAACANCGAALAGEYCAACGQRHEPQVHSVSHFAGEAFESVTHADSRLWRTLGYLVAKPGLLTLEFFTGRRARYLPPFRLYLVISLFFFLVAGPQLVTVNVTATPAEASQGLQEAADSLEAEFPDTPGIAETTAALRRQAAEQKALAEVEAVAPAEDPEVVTGDGFMENFCARFGKPDPAAGQNYAGVYNICRIDPEARVKALVAGIKQNLPRAMFLFLPLLAAIMKLMYWRPKRFYVEHLLLLVHNHAFVFLALAVVSLLTRVPVVGKYLAILGVPVWVYIIWYLFRAMRVYYGQSRGLTLVKYIVIGKAYFLTSILVLVLTLFYAMFTL